MHFGLAMSKYVAVFQLGHLSLTVGGAAALLRPSAAAGTGWAACVRRASRACSTHARGLLPFQFTVVSSFLLELFVLSI